MTSFLTLDVVPIIIILSLIVLEAILAWVRIQNGLGKAIVRNYRIHVIMIVQSASIAMALSGLELAVVGDTTDRIRVVGTVGGLVLFGLPVITYLDIVIDDWGTD